MSLSQVIRYISGKHTTINKIAFFVNEEYIFDHYRNIFFKLNKSDFEIILADKFSGEKYQATVNELKSNSWSIRFLNEVHHIFKYKILVTHLFLGGDTINQGTVLSRLVNVLVPTVNKILVKFNLTKISTNRQYFQNMLGIYNVRFMYGADVGKTKFGNYNHLFDIFFCHGPRDSAFIKSTFDKTIFEMGYPKYDDFFKNKNDLELKNALMVKNCCHNDKKTILWICTVSEYFSTIETYSDSIKLLTNNYNVIVRPHPLEIDSQYSRYNKKVYDIVNSGEFILNNDPYQNMSELYQISDYVFCDYGGSIFSALYLDKRILLLNHKDVFMDKEVFTSTSMEIRDYLPSININAATKIIDYLSNESFWTDHEEKRLEARRYYFGESRNSSELTAEKLLELRNNV
jgi:CDP-glycerol glycerophosphotransferase (TagB/SpsB family)